MEEDKKKKKNNKKKKNKQATKQTEMAKESTSDNQNHVSETVHDVNGQVSGGDIQVSSKCVPYTDIDSHGNHATGNDEVSITVIMKELQAEKEEKIKNEAILQEKIQQLLKEKNDYIQREAAQKEQIDQLCDERNSSMQNETSLKEKVAWLEKEKESMVQKEGILGRSIAELRRENEVHMQKLAGLEMNILQLSGEKDSWLQKEADFEDRINYLRKEAASLNLKTVSLEKKVEEMEREKGTWITRENSMKEMMTTQNNENIKLRVQVIQLEQSSENLLEEKQLLQESINNLQRQIKNLESNASLPHSSMVNKMASEDDGDVNNHIGAASTLVGKLTTENSEIVEKADELYFDLDQRGRGTEESFLALPSNLSIETTPATYLKSEASIMMPASNSTMSLEDIMIEDQINSQVYPGLANSPEIIELDEKESKSNVAPSNDDEEPELSLTDSPLIGAPFRFISFVARYVSGADLVK